MDTCMRCQTREVFGNNSYCYQCGRVMRRMVRYRDGKTKEVVH